VARTDRDTSTRFDSCLFDLFGVLNGMQSNCGCQLTNHNSKTTSMHHCTTMLCSPSSHFLYSFPFHHKTTRFSMASCNLYCFEAALLCGSSHWNRIKFLPSLSLFSLSFSISSLCCIEKVDSTISVAHIFQLTKFVIITRWYFDHATSYVPHILATIYAADKRTSSRRGKFRGEKGVEELKENFTQGISNICAHRAPHKKYNTQKRNYLCCTVWQEYGEGAQRESEREREGWGEELRSAE